MHVWIDLANSPHVPLLAPVVEQLQRDGNEVLLTARDHAQTVELARQRWPGVLVVGGSSPAGRLGKILEIARRALRLARLARRRDVDVALSHGSYAQAIAARLAGIPLVTMMDYEHQPANHLSFRLARRVIVPAVFPERALWRFGAGRKTDRYAGFKEELYLPARSRTDSSLSSLGLDPCRIVVVMRPPPEGALYHQGPNSRFDEVLHEARKTEGVDVVLLPRSLEQAARYGSLPNVTIPSSAVDGAELLAAADLVVGAGGTMNREAALLGTPTYTVFGSRLAAVDAALISTGAMHDLRDPQASLRIEKKSSGVSLVSAERRDDLLTLILETLRQTSAAGRGFPRGDPAGRDARDDRSGVNVLGDDRACTDDRAAPDSDASEHDRA
jgi:uncharacterized protein